MLFPTNSTGTTVRLGVAGALLTLAGVGAVVVPGPAHAEPAAPAPGAALNSDTTTLTIQVDEPRVAPGGRVTVGGVLTLPGGADPAGRRVVLEAKAPGERGFGPVATTSVYPGGAMSTTVRVAVDTRLRWTFAGASDAPPATSEVARVRLTTTMERSRRQPTLSARLVSRPTHRGVVQGTLRAGAQPQGGQLVVLLVRRAGQTTWVYDNTHLTDRHGRVHFATTPTTTSAFRLRYAGSTRLQPVRSGVVTLLARPYVAVEHPAEPVARGAEVSFAGSVVANGAPLAGASLDLVTERRSGAIHVVARGRTGADGSFALVDHPTRGGVYRVVVRSTRTTATYRSAPVRVRVQPAAGDPVVD